MPRPSSKTRFIIHQGMSTILSKILCCDFYYQFLLKNIEKIEAGNGEVLFERLKNEIHSFIAYGFEDISISYIEGLSGKGMLGGIYYPIRNFIIEKLQLNRSIEIDDIARDGDSLLVIDYKRMISTSIKMFSSMKRIDYYIISKCGFEESLLSMKDEHLHLISLDNMFDR